MLALVFTAGSGDWPILPGSPSLEDGGRLTPHMRGAHHLMMVASAGILAVAAGGDWPFLQGSPSLNEGGHLTPTRGGHHWWTKTSYIYNTFCKYNTIYLLISVRYYCSIYMFIVYNPKGPPCMYCQRWNIAVAGGDWPYQASPTLEEGGCLTPHTRGTHH